MTRHGFIAALCLAVGLLLLGAGALLPAHVRAVDRDVLELAARGSTSLTDVAREALLEERVGVAEQWFATAGRLGLTNGVEGAQAALEVAGMRAELGRWGGRTPWLEQHLGNAVMPGKDRPLTVLSWALVGEARALLLRPLGTSTQPGVMALLACRRVEQMSLFPAVGTASGQPLDAVLLVCAALTETGRIRPSLALEFERAATAAEQGRGTVTLERGLLDLLALMRRMDWESLATFLEKCEDLATLQRAVMSAGDDDARWGVLQAAGAMTGGLAGVTGYLQRNGEAGYRDLEEGLRLGQGGVRTLVESGHRLHRPGPRAWLVERVGGPEFREWLAQVAARSPWFTVGLKYLLWADGLFLVVHGLWHARRTTLDEANRVFEPRPNLAAHLVVTLAGTVLIFLTVEQYLTFKRSAAAGRGGAPVSMVTARVRLEVPRTKQAMNDKIVGMLVAFFVIQAALYLVGLMRLKNIRDQLVEAPTKLRLLDNEETMFDAPLYLGIAGSVFALILKFSGFEGVSMMASYSSTLFGILFCFILKVMHVRPYRQRLILESARES